MTHYEIWLAQPDSTRIEKLRPSSIEWVHVLGDVGRFTIKVPWINREAAKELPDRRIEIMRQSKGSRIYREFNGFIDTWEPSQDANGKPQLAISGHDGGGFLDRRMQVDGSGQLYLSLSSEYVDDAMKDIVRNNLISSGTAARDLTIFTCDPDVSNGPQITRVYNNSSALKILQDLQAYSREQGNEVFWSMRPNGSSWAFQTKTGQLDENRSDTGNTPMVFGDRWRNITNQNETITYSKVLTNVYALGSGLDDNQSVQEVENSELANISIYGRREGSVFAPTSDLSTALSDAGEEHLAYSRPYRRLVADILDTRETPYGILGGWRLGTKVTTDVFNKRRDAVIRAVRVMVDGFGREQIRGSIEVIE